MEMDRHKLWRKVASDHEHFAQEAPDGFEARTCVYVSGRAEPIEIGLVVTRREPDYQWVAFSTVSPMRAADPEGSQEKTYPDDAIIYVHEQTVLRVEVDFVPKEPGAKPRPPFGFTIE